MYLLFFLQDLAADPVKDAVMKFLATYGGLAMGVTFLVSSAKVAWKKFVNGKEPLLTVVLSYVLGIAAKLATPFYGESDVSSWAIHLVVLSFVAVGAAAFHDKVVNAILGKEVKR